MTLRRSDCSHIWKTYVLSIDSQKRWSISLKFLIISTVNSWFLIDSNAPTALDIIISAVHDPSSL